MNQADRRVRLLLFVLSFASLSALGHHSWGTIDAIQRFAVTRAILHTGSVITPEFGPVKYGPLQSVLMLPTCAIGYGVGLLSNAAEPDRVAYRLTAFVFTPSIVSILVVLWFSYARRWGASLTRSAAGAWTMLWCTLLMPYSRLLFADPLSAALIFAGISGLIVPSGEGSPLRWRGFLCLAGAALNYLVFLPLLAAAVFAVPFGEARSGRPWMKHFVAGAATLALTTGAWLAYDFARYGKPLEVGYGEEGFTTPLLVGLYGLLFSPGRGLLFYSVPSLVAVVACAWSVATWRPASARRDLVALVLFMSYLLLYARWGSFEGGWCWGPRFLLAFIPLLHLSLVPVLTRWPTAAASAVGFLVNAWEYSSEWQAFEKATFNSGVLDYRLSVFDLRYVPALHGFAGITTLERGLQFGAIAGAATFALAYFLRRSAIPSLSDTPRSR